MTPNSQVLRGAVLMKRPSFSGFLKYWSSGKKSRLQFKVIGVYNLAWTPGWSVRTGEDPSPRPLSPHLHTTGCQQRGQVCCGGQLFRSHVATQKLKTMWILSHLWNVSSVTKCWNSPLLPAPCHQCSTGSSMVTTPSLKDWGWQVDIQVWLFIKCFYSRFLQLCCSDVTPVASS